MMRFKSKTFLSGMWLASLMLVLCGSTFAADTRRPAVPAATAAPAKSMSEVLPPAKWRQLESSVDRALAWLVTQQAADGSFETVEQGQPAVTALCVMALLSRGHQPGYGPYGAQLNRAIDYVIACQQPDGLLCKQVVGPSFSARQASQTATYNHGIAGLMLGEVYGQVTGERSKNVKETIEKALQFTRNLQLRPKAAVDTGGWRYLRYAETTVDSDLSVTAWQLMFLRSAKNAEFDVPQQYVDEAMGYVRRCFQQSGGGPFLYTLSGQSGGNASRGMAGAGIVALSMGGQHQTDMALSAGNWLLANPYRSYGQTIGSLDKYIYSTFYCSQAAAQLGGRYWEGIFPPLVDTLLGAQKPAGNWTSEADLAMFGDTLTTAFAVLSLTPPYQYLPVYQR